MVSTCPLIDCIGFGLKAVPYDQAIETMRAALEAGANVWNGADFYGPPDANSLQLLHAYFTKYPDDASRVVIVMKTLFAVPNGPDCSAENVEKCVSNILKVLDGKCFIDVLEPGRIDPKVSVEDTMKYLLPYVQSGKIGGIGLSEAKAETIRRAAAITKISSLEIELSLFSTDPLSNGQAVACAELDIPIVAYSPLSRGFLSGQLRSYSDLAENDNRKRYPRYQPEVFDENLKLVHEMEKVAKRKGVTTPQVALAWVAGLSNQKGMPTIIPIPGTTTVGRVRENTKVIKLEEQDLKEIDAALKSIEIKGDRYPAMFQKYADA